MLPLSKKLWVSASPLYVTVRTPGPSLLDEVVSGSTVAALSALSVWVPMPNVTVPVGETTPRCSTAGRVMIVPLLSTANAATGLGSCSKGAAVTDARAIVAAQPLGGQS